MANELTVAANLSFVKGSVSVSMAIGATRFTVTGTDYMRGTQTVGTAAEALDIGDITTPGWMLIVNRDATNYVEIRDGADGADVVKIKAGEFALFRLATTTPYVIATTAACQVEYVVVED